MWLPLCCLLLTVADGAVRKKSSLHQAPPASSPRDMDCSNLPGVWTGFFPQPLNDEYELAWTQQGGFTSVMIRGGGWSLGTGQLGPDNTTAKLVFDTSVTLLGKVSDDCETIAWDNNSTWRKKSMIDVVHIVAMNHLDLGYNGVPGTGLINNILNRYFQVYFPRAIAMANALRDLGLEERLIYTTHPWLLYMYLHCPANFVLSGIELVCPSNEAVTAMRESVKRGDIYFHAGLFNTEYENCFNEEMIDTQFQYAKDLADDLGVPQPTVVSLRDVPGTTRALIPLMVKNGLTALSVGVNGGSPAPEMPNPGIWRDPGSNTQVLYMQTGQGQGYPNNPGPDPTKPEGMAASSCVRFQGLSHVLCWAFRTDNSGPPESVAEVQNQFDIARWQFPGARVIASTYDAFVSELSKVAPSLPVDTHEVGDTWITSTTADPVKLALYRLASRLYTACLSAKQCDPHDPRIAAFNLMMAKIPEHTYGYPGIADDANYTNAQFRAAFQDPAVQVVLASYTEQRDILTKYGIPFLADHPLRGQIESEWAALAPVMPDVSQWVKIDPSRWTQTFNVKVSGGEVDLGFDGKTGAIGALSLAGRVWADSMHPLAQFYYQAFNSTHDYDKLADTCCWWDNKRQNITRAQASTNYPTMNALWADSASNPRNFVVLGSMGTDIHTNYGAPATVVLEVSVQDDGSVPLNFQMFNCTLTRLGGAHMLSFTPVQAAGGAWMMDKLGSWIDPLNVVNKGSQFQHAVRNGVKYEANGQSFYVDTLDAPVFNPISSLPAQIFQQPAAPLKGPITGFVAQLMQNAFSTNTPLFQWDGNYRFRFILHAE
jgi:hypothetical protein